MAELHVSASDFASNFGVLLAKVSEGFEIIVEQDHRPVAVLRAMLPPRRTASEILALTPRNSTAIMNDEFAADVQAAIDAHREPLDSKSWD